MTYEETIAIIGAGPAGLTLGLLLHKRSIPFTIYDLRAQPTQEDLAKSSGALDLHQDSGLAAIRELGLEAEFTALTGECAEAMKIADKHGTVIYEDDKTRPRAPRPEISRNNLTSLLLSQLPPQSIQWSHKLLGASTNSGQTTLDFGFNGTKVVHLVVGADGAWSKIRALRSAAKPIYTGRHYTTLTLADLAQTYPDIAALVGLGTFFAMARGSGIITQRSANDSLRIYVVTQVPGDAEWVLTGLRPSQAKSVFLGDNGLFSTWASPLQDLVSHACDGDTAEVIETRAMYELPADYTWNEVPGITIIGDAAHLTLNGEGVNMAMLDALELSRAIGEAYEGSSASGVEFQERVNPLLERFEEGMLQRARKKHEDTVEQNAAMFGVDGSAGMKEWMLKMISMHK
jgi:2-polyprenyl-6-methoxyphenol hydroxylase-like FAD-dependent oxidoreductase